VTIRSSSSEVSSPALRGVSPRPPHNTKLPIPFVEIDIGLLANQVAVPTSNTLYLCQGVHDLWRVSGVQFRRAVGRSLPFAFLQRLY
jgi:hypothetical protein